MKNHSTLLLRAGSLAVLLGTVILFVAWSSDKLPKAHAFHSEEELAAFERGTGLSSGANHYFKGSGMCSGCHGHDPSGFAMTTQEGGVDVNVVDAWRSTMMANSAKDPFWRAKVSHEVQVNPAHQTELEDKCTSCHAPMGRHDKFLTGMGPYSMAELQSDPLAQDGVSCVPCHIQSADSIGLHFSGNLKFDTLNRPLYGPYGFPGDPNPIFGAPMSSFVGYEPQYGAQFKPLGDAFIKLVKMVIAPVIFLTVATGIAHLRDLGRLGKVVGKAFDRSQQVRIREGFGEIGIRALLHAPETVAILIFAG